MTLLRKAGVAAIFIAVTVLCVLSVERSSIAKESSDYRQAPEFAGIGQWINSDPLTLAALRGKVVLVDFWTYDCINCVHTLPHLNRWHAAYKDKGFLVVGVHTPETDEAHDIKRVREAVDRFAIRYPVAQDNEFATWNAYRNKYWPTAYLVDRNGRIVFVHIGEGDYDEMESAIRKALAS